jgi:DHA2 family lincomycin resistance protein-like MFS transporter
MTHSLVQPKRPAAVKAILLFTAFVAMLNETSINVALTALMGVFGVSVTTVQWLVTGFMLVMAVVVPVTAFLQHRFSTRGLYFFSLALLLVGAAVAGFAPDFVVLLIARLVQSMATCIVMSVTVTTVLQLTPPEGRGGAMGLVGLVTLFAPAVAPTIGGIVLQTLGWNWIFLGSLPFLVIVGVVALKFLESVAVPQKLKLDLVSVVWSALGLGGVVLGLGELSHWAEAPLVVAVPLVVGVVGLVLFVTRQKNLAHPLVDLRVFSYRQFSLAMVFVFVCILSVFGLTMLTPMALGQVWLLGAAAAGLSMLPGGVLNGLTAPVFGQLYDKIGPKAVAFVGTLFMVLAMGSLAFLPASAPFWVYIVCHIVFLLGISAAMTVNQANGMNALEPRLIPHGTAVMSTLMQLAGGVGTALYVSVLASNPSPAPIDHFHTTFFWGALLLFVPLAASLFLKKSVHPTA